MASKYDGKTCAVCGAPATNSWEGQMVCRKHYNITYFATPTGKAAKAAAAAKYAAANPLAVALRGRLGKALKAFTTTGKTQHTLEYLGCDMAFFTWFISSQFVEGMTLENYGEWELDHVKPCALLKTGEGTVEQIFHWTNFQPLWASANASKNDTFTPEMAKAWVIKVNALKLEHGINPVIPE